MIIVHSDSREPAFRLVCLIFPLSRRVHAPLALSLFYSHQLSLFLSLLVLLYFRAPHTKPRGHLRSVSCILPD